MKVFVAGATGVLGRRLVQRLSGHEVLGLARSPAKARLLEQQGAVPCEVSLFDADQLAQAADGCDVVVHAATSIPMKARTSARDWEENDRIRREGTRALTDCAAKIGAKAYVQQSVVWVARPADGSAFDEDSPASDHPLMQSAYDSEQMVLEAGKSHGFDSTVLRCGWFYGHDAGHTQMFREGLRKRQIPVIGSGDAVWACLHLDDAASAFLATIEQPQTGLWHVVDNEPVTVRDFLCEFAGLLDAKPPRSAPVWLARILAGTQAVEFFTHSTQTTNQKFRRGFDWSPQFGDYRAGLKQVVDQWQTSSA